MLVFERNGVKKTVNEESATPSNISKFYNVKPELLMLHGDNGDLVNVKNGKFDKLLKHGVVYQVEDVEGFVTSADADVGEQVLEDVVVQEISENSTATVDADNEDTLSQGPLMEVKRNISKSLELISDNMDKFYIAPNAVMVAKRLALSAVEDKSLVSEKKTKEQYNCIENPESLQLTIFQLASIFCETIKKTDNFMRTLWVEFVDLPNLIRRTLTEAINGESNKELNELIQRSETSFKKCENATKKAMDSKTIMIDFLQEFVDGIVSTESASEKGVKDIEEMLPKVEDEKNQRSEDIVKRKSENAKNIKLVQEAFNDHRKLCVSGVDYQLSLTAFTDFLTENGKTSLITFGPSFLAFLQIVKKVPKPDWISLSLGAGLSVGGLIWSEVKRYNEKEKEHFNALDIARHRIDSAKKNKETNLEAMRRSEREVENLIAKIQDLESNKIELNDAILLFQEILPMSKKLQKLFTNMKQFLEVFNTVVSDGLIKSIQDFTDRRNNGGNVDFETLIKSYLIASGMCVQICIYASIYREISSQCVQPAITTVKANLQYSKAGATVKKDMFQMENEMMHESVRRLIDTKMKNFDDKFVEDLEKLRSQI